MSIIVRKEVSYVSYVTYENEEEMIKVEGGDSLDLAKDSIAASVLDDVEYRNIERNEEYRRTIHVEYHETN